MFGRSSRTESDRFGMLCFLCAGVTATDKDLFVDYRERVP
jgi:hypothetical protein